MTWRSCGAWDSCSTGMSGQRGFSADMTIGMPLETLCRVRRRWRTFLARGSHEASLTSAIRTLEGSAFAPALQQTGVGLQDGLHEHCNSLVFRNIPTNDLQKILQPFLSG